MIRLSDSVVSMCEGPLIPKGWPQKVSFTKVDGPCSIDGLRLCSGSKMMTLHIEFNVL